MRFQAPEAAVAITQREGRRFAVCRDNHERVQFLAYPKHGLLRFR